MPVDTRSQYDMSNNNLYAGITNVLGTVGSFASNAGTGITGALGGLGSFMSGPVGLGLGVLAQGFSAYSQTQQAKNN